ncbi:uncharacterized protein LOC124420756 [Lucilia cuprina]|uniref:uncharacterized protein LOC124420756 n=1 Tax=Lucilia cuprina TaxID=7375 RepID=UPI001F054054|nr:uncharacterized protein LOC124420756 [Lucilia cuprina]
MNVNGCYYNGQWIKFYKNVQLTRDDDDSEDEFEFRGFTNHEANMFIESPFVNSFQLSKHYHCGSHTLNLLSTTDYIKLLQEEGVLFQIHNSAITKCENIWSKTKRPKSYEQIYEILSATLKTPTITR